MAGGGAGSRIAGSVVDITEQKQAVLRQDLEQAVATLLSQTNSALAAMPALLQLLARQLGWCCGAVWMQGSDDATARQVASWALPGSRFTRFLEVSGACQQQQLCRMLAGAALATAAPVMLDDFESQRRFPRLQAARQAGLRCALAVPLRTAGESVGILELFGPAPQSLDAGWLRSALAIGQQAGQALRRERAESALTEARTQLQVLLAHGSDSFYVHDALGQICDVNQSACDMLGYERDELLQLEHPQVDADIPFRRLQEIVDANTHWPSIFPLPSRHRRRDGSLFPVEISVGRIEFANQSHWVTVARDISLSNELQAQMTHLACHDPLTGLHNRAMFSRQLSAALGRARQGGSGLAVLLIDLDRFKLINDALGHHAGDRLLQEMARRLRAALPPGATIARMGGDEFTVLVNEAALLQRLPQLARQILQTLVIEYPLEGQRLHITASIGISTCPQDGHDEYTLLKRADQAMYRAKEAGRNTCVLYSSQMDPSPAAQLTLESDLRRAIERNALMLRFQPKVSAQTSCITGSEVLVRWQHEELGLLQPEDFIPIAEETGLIVPLTKWILMQACHQNCEWRRQGLPALRLAINLSARQFADGGLLADIEFVLAETGMDPALLELEITESMMMRDTLHTQQMLLGLKALGVHIALDDFGVAYSSLSHLKRFPIDIIKIDRSFITGIPGSDADVAITEAIIALSHKLDISVVAEGVEKTEQLKFLRSRQCNELQGYLFSRPLDANAFSALVLQGRPEEQLAD